MSHTDKFTFSDLLSTCVENVTGSGEIVHVKCLRVSDTSETFVLF